MPSSASLTARRSHLVLETAPAAFIGIDMEGCIVTWNAKATQNFGYRGSGRLHALGQNHSLRRIGELLSELIEYQSRSCCWTPRAST
jgi:PAS domain-containing protein